MSNILSKLNKIKFGGLTSGLDNFSIKSKLQTMFLAVSLVTVGLITWASYDQGRSLLKDQIVQKLKIIRTSTAEELELFFEKLYQQVEFLAGEQKVLEAMVEFDTGFGQLEKKGDAVTLDSSLESYYTEKFFPRLAQNLSDRELEYSIYRPAGQGARYLQHYYLAQNPDPTSEQEQTIAPGDDTQYTQAHIKYHEFFQNLVETQGYDNLFLIDTTGDVIYSVFKQTDYGTNLLQGPYSQSGLADAVRDTLSERDPGSIQVADFRPYRPAYEAPTAFISTPLYRGSKLIGILAVQLSIDEINQVIARDNDWESRGLGKTGEIYVVGSDSLMRSVSRAWVDNPQQYKNDVRQQGTGDRTLRLIERLDTTVGLQKMDSSLVQAALGGQEGIALIENYRGKKVLTAYGPLEVPGLDWAILAEIEVAEAYQPLYILQVKLLIASAIFLLLIALLAAIASSIFAKPVNRLIKSTQKIAAGELEAEIPVTSEEEIGQLARSLKVIVNKLRHTAQQLQTQKQENDTLLHNFLPYSAAERIKNGESLIADQSNQVTFLYAHVVGIAELSKRMPSKKVTALLTKLFDEFDQTAEEYGIDRQTTIGADYIAVCGLSQPRLDHTKRTIDFALEMLDTLARLGFNYNPLLGLRIGIHTGSATAGVVGSEKYSYIIWGEDIYLGSRLYTQAEPNRIVLTRSAYERVADAYIFVQNPSVEIQGIGDVESWTMFTTPKIAIDKVDLVQSSFAEVVPIAETAAKLFYQRLFELDPDLRALFKGDMKAQQRKLMSALAVAVEGLKEPEKILSTVQELGRRHVGYGAKSEHYDLVMEALIYSLEQGLGDRFTLPVRDAWEEALTFVSDVMKDAATDLEYEAIGA